MNDLKNKTDIELLKIIESNPNSEKAVIAQNILLFRNNQELRNQGKGILILTIVLAMTSIISVIVQICNSIN